MKYADVQEKLCGVISSRMRDGTNLTEYFNIQYIGIKTSPSPLILGSIDLSGSIHLYHKESIELIKTTSAKLLCYFNLDTLNLCSKSYSYFNLPPLTYINSTMDQPFKEPFKQQDDNNMNETPIAAHPQDDRRMSDEWGKNESFEPCLRTFSFMLKVLFQRNPC